jgi:co-chaperonin GroES (HSP10)
MIKLKAVGNRIIVKADLVEKAIKTDSGVLIHKPENVIAQEEGGNDKGTIIGIGEFAWDDYDGPWCKVGDKVMWPRYAGRRMDLGDDNDIFVLNCQDILCGYEEVSDD